MKAVLTCSQRHTTRRRAEALALLSKSQRWGYDLFALPTSKGWICPILVDGSGYPGSSGCERGLYRGITVQMEGDSDTARIFGLVADDIVSVGVTVNGSPTPATLGRNGFLLVVDAARFCAGPGFQTLSARRQSGAVETRDLASPPGTDCWEPSPD